MNDLLLIVYDIGAIDLPRRFIFLGRPRSGCVSRSRSETATFSNA